MQDKQNSIGNDLKRLKSDGLFQQVTTEKKKAALAKRFGAKSFCERTKWLKDTAFTFSFLINLLSIIAAFYGAYWAISFMGVPPAFAACLSITALILLEVAKRRSSDEVWDEYWKDRKFHFGWVTLSLTLFVISVSISSFGIWQGTQDFSEAPQAITSDSTINMLNGEIAKTSKGIEEMSATRWKGTITQDAQMAIGTFAKTQNRALTALLSQQSEIKNQNNNNKLKHELSALKAAGIAVALYLLFELLFEACMSFCSHYDFRDFLETMGVTEEQIKSNNFRNSQQFQNLMRNMPENQYEENNTVCFSAIKKRLEETPPLPVEENRVTPVYTQLHNSATVAEKQNIRIVGEVIEDVEESIKTLCGKIQKFYPSRWEKAIKSGGKTSTMATNFHTFLSEIENILKENPTAVLSEKWKKRVEEYRTIYQTKIKQQ